MKSLLLAALLVSACENRESAPIKREPERQRRVIDPPSGRVRPLPPHAIRADAVGPYKLHALLADLLDQLPAPRNPTLDIPGVLHTSLLRAEEDAILIGGEPLGKATFIAVVGSEVARTESGIHVGSTREELVRALGAPAIELDRARDPRVIAPGNMRNLRALVDGDKIAAIVIAAEPETKPLVPTGNECARPAVDPDREAKTDKLRFGACLGSGELVAVDGDDVIVKLTGTERPVSLRIPGLVFAAPVRSATDGRDELVAIAHSGDAAQRTWSLVVLRLEGTRLVRAIEQTLYQLTSSSARWIGAELADLDLYLEIQSRAGAIEVGGLLTTRIDNKIRDVVAISPVVVTRRHAKAQPAETVDAGVGDAHAETKDAADAKGSEAK